MVEEIDSLIKNNTWSLEFLPEGRKAVKNKWVFRVKVKSNGTIERFKARLVAKGFTQTHGIDYQETFAPTVRAESIRILLAVAAVEDLDLVQFDIKTAYLNATLHEEIYMELPQGFEEEIYRRFPGSHGKLCRIRKGLYGLKQSAREWNHTFSDFLKRYNLLQSPVDPCIFYSNTHPRLTLSLWVDDGLAMCQDPKLLHHVVEYLKSTFEVTVGAADTYVGLHITRHRFSKTLYIDQHRYTETVLTRFGFQDATPISTPSDSHVHLTSPQKDDGAILPIFPYQEIVGSFIAIFSNPYATRYSLCCLGRRSIQH